MYLEQIEHGVRHLTRLLDGKGPEPLGSPLMKKDTRSDDVTPVVTEE